MKQSSKNRLMPQHQSLFDKDTLFDKIARSVCRAGTLPRKELYEAWETARRVRRRYKGGRVVDLACGHGLLAHIMLILDKTSDHALCIDRKLPANAQKLSQTLVTDWPRLGEKIHFKEMDIEEVTIFPDDVVVSAHACGVLTDLVIDKAVKGNARLAVLPCCHNLKTCPTGNLDNWMESTLAVDAVRAMNLQSRGYEIFTAKIPDTITPKNRLLLGHPVSPSPVNIKKAKSKL